MIASPLDSASSRLLWSNVVYVGGAALTFAAAMMVFIDKRLQRTLFTEWIAIGAAVVSLVGTLGAIHYGNVVSGLKDAALASYEKDADLKIAQAQERVAAAELRTEQERLARLRLEQKVAPRRITPNQRTLLVRCLGNHEGERIYLTGQGGQDPEIEDFGKQLESVLREAGFQDVRFNPMNMPGAIGDGSFTLSAGKDRIATANLLASCFKKAGVAFTAIKKEPPDQPKSLGILVGYKQR